MIRFFGLIIMTEQGYKKVLYDLQEKELQAIAMAKRNG